MHTAALDKDGNQLHVGDQVEVVDIGGHGMTSRELYPLGTVLTVDSIDSAGIVHCEDSRLNVYSCRFRKVKKPCCTLQEAADLLEAEGIQVDRKQLEKVLNPRPKTLPLNKIRVRGRGCKHPSILVQVYNGYLVVGHDHNYFSEARVPYCGHMNRVNLDELEEFLTESSVYSKFSILDTWSADTEFPELLES